MKRTIIALLFSAVPLLSFAQATFKAGWNTYQTGTMIREYCYNYVNDTARITTADSAITFISPDSLVSMTVRFPQYDKARYKTIHYFSPKKLILKTEEYKDDNLLMSYEWRYDDKNRKNYQFEDNKATGNNFRKTYDYSTDKKTGDMVVSETSYFNGRIEFYTKTYYDKSGNKYKEVRLNDNNKDVVHVETYTYGDNGKVKERSVYFPEWKVTKKFQEREGNMLPKCYRCLPVGTAEKIYLPGRIYFIRKLVGRNMALLSDPECSQYEYTFKNFTNCEIVIATTGVNNTKKISFKYKEKLL